MSREEAVQSYLSGRLGRRAFMRQMIGAGASLTAAAAAADALRATPASAQKGDDDIYDDDIYPETPVPVTPVPVVPVVPPTDDGGKDVVHPVYPVVTPKVVDKKVVHPVTQALSGGGQAKSSTTASGGQAKSSTSASGTGAAVSGLPSTGAGQASDESGGFLKPITLAASAAAAAFAIRMRQLRKPEPDSEVE